MRLALFVALLWWNTWAIAGDEVTGISPSGRADGKDFTFHVHAETVRDTPPWPLDATCPPLPPRRAIEIARKQLNELVNEPSKWYFHEISLVDFGDHIHWVYVAMFDREYSQEHADYYFHIPVLMTGDVVKPQVRALPPENNTPK